ncbi:MAG TPA: DUF2259 domain-containing protein [Spirochaetia bacterium]|nr:DUF2259 domain-containing protein [Spirochaetia bacterium]
MAAWRRRLILGMAGIALVFANVPVFAGDQARSLFVGFSDDGKYCAVETVGVQDGSGFPYATLFIIDVAANDWATDPVSIVLKTTGAVPSSALDAHDALWSSSKGALTRYGIDPSRAGRLIAASDPNRVEFKAGEDSYALVLTASPAKGSTDDMPLALMELQLLHGSDHRVLQKDASVPKSRGNAYAYRISEVRLDGDNLAIIIDYDRTGFEGPDTRQIVVTTRLNP